MNASFSPDSSRQAPAAQGAASGGRQTPSVPISVYRELATELKATQAMVDSLTQQNQQLSQQNQILRQEMLNFAESADRLRQSVEYSQPQPTPAVHPVGQFPATGPGSGAVPLAFVTPQEDETSTEAAPLAERLGESMGSGVSNLASHLGRLVTPTPKKKAMGRMQEGHPPKQKPAASGSQRLYTEERLEPARGNQMSGGSADLSGLWLATTILLIVISAFGAGFFIMKPLLNNSR
jgi:hypothetical protein